MEINKINTHSSSRILELEKELEAERDLRMKLENEFSLKTDKLFREDVIIAFSQNPVTAESFSTKFHLSIPKTWRGLVSKDGQILWKFESTLLVRFLGVSRARTAFWFLAGTVPRILCWVTIQTVALILIFLGLTKVVPEEAFITSSCVCFTWQIVSLSMIVDTRIFARIFFSLNSQTVFLAAVIAGISIGFLLQWDYRGCAIVVIVPTILSGGIMEECIQYRIRNWVAVPFNVMYICIFIGIFLIFNLDMVPDALLSVNIFTLALSATLQVPFNALSILNQSLGVLIVLYLNMSYVFLISAIKGTPILRTAVIPLECVDDPEAGPVETLIYLDDLVKSLRSLMRRCLCSARVSYL
jgi:hypothetical protein